MSRYVTLKGADGSTSGGGAAGLTAEQLGCHVQWHCLIHCYPWTVDYGSNMTIKLPWTCYDAFEIKFNGFKHRNCCYENTYCFMPEWNGNCLCDSMQNWMCHYCSNCFARGSWESYGQCHTMRTQQCCCTSGYGSGCIAYSMRLLLFKDGTRNCNAESVTKNTAGLGYSLCYWNHCDNYGCANAKWGTGCIRCLYDVGWPGWCNSTERCHWTGLYIKNNCGYMEPYNDMAYSSVYGIRNPNITGTGSPAPGYQA